MQYPRNKQQEMLAAQQHQQQQQQRTLGTHTLGRLPSHNHSPSHHGGGGKHGKFYEFSSLFYSFSETKLTERCVNVRF